MAAGLGLVGAALVEAVEVGEIRRDLLRRDAAWRQRYLNPPLPEPFRPPPPPLPEIPLEFPEDESPREKEIP